jgi:O-antigen ligase
LKLPHSFTPRSLGFEPDKPLESISFFLLLALVASAPFPWGAVLPAGQFRIELFAFLIAATTLASRAPLTAIRPAAVPVLLLVALASLGAVQLIPLPQDILEAISPGSAEAYHETNQILEAWGRMATTGRVSIAPAATRSMLLQVFALAMLGASAIVILRSRRRRRTFLAIFLGSALIQAIVSVSTFGPRTTGRISGAFVNPNHFSGYLSIALFCAMGVLWREVLFNRQRSIGARDRGEVLERRVLPISLAALLVGAIGVGLSLTKSRGGIAAAVFGVVAFVVIGISHQRTRRRARAAILGLLMTALALAFVAATAKREPVLRYLESDRREIAADTRVQLWQTSFDAWKDYRLLGSGLGSFREAYRPHQPKEITQLVEQAHSDPLQILVTGGALGLALSVSAMLATLALLMAGFYRQEHREESSFVLAGITALITLTLHGLVEFNFSIPAIPATLVCIIGLSFAAANWHGSSSESA